MVSLRQTRWGVVLVVLLGVAAGAQTPAPTVTPFPLDVKRTPAGFSNKDVEQLMTQLPRLLRKEGAMVPDTARYGVALRELKRQDCEREDECLKQLAQKAETLYALYASVDYTIERKVVATGRVVRDDGVAIGRLEMVSVPKGDDAFKDVAIVALGQLLHALGVKALPMVRAALVADAPRIGADAGPGSGAVGLTPPPPLPPPPQLVTEGPRLRAVAELGFAVAGGGLLVTGAVLAGLANGALGGLTIRDRSIAPADFEKWSSLRSQETAGWALIGAGAVVGGTGGVLWLLDAPPAVVVAPSATAQGAGVVVSGRLP